MDYLSLFLGNIKTRGDSISMGHAREATSDMKTRFLISVLQTTMVTAALALSIIVFSRDSSPQPLVFAIAGLLGAAALIAAVRTLRHNRKKPG